MTAPFDVREFLGERLVDVHRRMTFAREEYERSNLHQASRARFITTLASLLIEGGAIARAMIDAERVPGCGDPR